MQKKIYSNVHIINVKKCIKNLINWKIILRLIIKNYQKLVSPLMIMENINIMKESLITVYYCRKCILISWSLLLMKYLMLLTFCRWDKGKINRVHELFLFLKYNYFILFLKIIWYLYIYHIFLESIYLFIQCWSIF